VDSTNYEKFQTKNPVVRRLIDGFYDRIAEAVAPLEPSSLLDAGCGEGETLARLKPSLPARAAGVDVSPQAIEFTERRLPQVELSCQSIGDLSFADDSFELVLCLEVLEHIPDPDRALADLARVASDYLVISVPHEPWFRVGSLLRGKYVRTLGNHPEHVNHWNRGSLRAFLEPHLQVVSLRGSFPWLIAVCRPSR
jgi:SAM-dependent methyltransferase